MTQFISMEWSPLAATSGLSLYDFKHFWGQGSCRRECESHIVVDDMQVDILTNEFIYCALVLYFHSPTARENTGTHRVISSHITFSPIKK